VIAFALNPETFAKRDFLKVSSCLVKMTYLLLIFNYHKSISENCKTVDKILFCKINVIPLYRG